jgi:hypothetical protein
LKNRLHGSPGGCSAHTFAAIGALACFAAAGTASAATPAQKQAQALLKQGKQLMDARQYARACATFAESQGLAPSPSTLLQLALCHEKEGKIATAYGEFNSVVSQARSNDPSAKTARQHADALSAKLPRLTIKVPFGWDGKNLSVTLDGQPVSSTSWNLPNSIDPGPHKVVASAKGNPPWTKTIVVTGPGDERTVEVLAAQPKEVSPEEVAQKEKKLENPFDGEGGEPKQIEESSGPPRSVAGIVLLSSGIAVTSLGLYFGYQAITLREDSNQRCRPGCNQEGVDLNDRAKTNAWLSNFGVGLGLAGVAVGAYLLLRAPDASSPSEGAKETSWRVVPRWSGDSGGVVVGRAW